MMNFYSIEFFCFLVAALVCYYTIFRKKQWICLLVVSAVFYYWTGIENFVFLLLTGFTTFGGAIRIEKFSRQLACIRKDKTIEKIEKDKRKKEIQKKRRMIMWSIVFLNFGMLACLKYFPVTHILGLILPLGISFYTFQSIGYLLDIYNEKYEAEKNLGRYLLFVSYFPQMIQGPINRYHAMSAQFLEEHTFDLEYMIKASYRFFYGLMKKYAIANILSGMIADIFDKAAIEYSGSTILFGILLYSAQQYADFSGGIDMVLGISEWFDIRMGENFKQPYFSTSLADFWRRWHISLGKWMRDYVFYPFALTKPMKKFGKWANKNLGKHLGRVLPAAIGNIVVFFIVGIWHGARWHYVVWGLYNGVVIALSDMLAPVYAKLTVLFRVNTKSFSYRIFAIIRTFIVVNIGWYFDRISDIKLAFLSLKGTIFNFHLERFPQEYGIVMQKYREDTIKIALLGCCFVFIVSLLEEWKGNVREKLYTKPVWIKWPIYLFVIGLILISQKYASGTGGFMYANF